MGKLTFHVPSTTTNLVMLLALVFFVNGAAKAQTIRGMALETVQQLRDVCQADVRIHTAEDAHDFSHITNFDWLTAGECDGFVEGTAHAYDNSYHYGALANGKTVFFRYTLSDRVTTRQAIDVFLRYANDHPAYQNAPVATHLLTCWLDAGILHSENVTPCAKSPESGDDLPSCKDVGR